MFKSKILKKFLALFSAVTVFFTALNTTRFSAVAFDKEYISSDGMQLGYDIISGYSKLAVKNNLTSYNISAVYSGLDVNSPYLIALLGIFYVTNGVDIDKAMGDNDYTMELIAKLDSFLGKMGIKNDRAKDIKNTFLADKIKIINSFDTAGLYIIESDEKYCKNLENNENVDFILAGGKMPPSLKDLNFDGKSDSADAEYIQKYLVKNFSFKDRQENEYLKFACDINGDKELDILDVTDLLKNEK